MSFDRRGGFRDCKRGVEAFASFRRRINAGQLGASRQIIHLSMQWLLFGRKKLESTRKPT